MKTTQFFIIGFFGLCSFFSNAQVATVNVTSYGLQAGTSSVSNSYSTYYGYQAGQNSSTTAALLSNSLFGYQSGKNITTGTNNSYFGSMTGGSYNGFSNSFFGANAGPYVTANDNVCIGANTMNYNTTGINGKCTAIGSRAGIYGYGSENIYLGYQAGAYKTGNNNIFIGNNTGESSSNKLHIDNAATATPLIWGDFASDQVKLNGKVGIGSVTTFPSIAGTVNVSNYRLFVTGGILTEEIRVKTSSGGTWADYVFAKDYNLKPLSEVEKFIETNGHLPNVPNANQVKEEGINVGEMAKIQQEKIEELTLYLIQQNKEIEELKTQMKVLLDSKQ